MNICMRIGLVALFMAWGAVAATGEEFSEVEYYKRLAEEQLAKERAAAAPSAPSSQGAVAAPAPLPEEAAVSATPSPVEQTIYYEYCEEEAPANAFVVIPRYFNSRNSAARATVDGQRLRLGGSRANGAGVEVAYTRRVGDFFSFGFVYEYGFLGVRGSGVTADDPSLSARERSRWHSHRIGLRTEFDFGDWGRFSPSVDQSFERGSGQIRIFRNGNYLESTSMDGEGANVTSLMAWYEKDFEFNAGWKLTPYAGWRSLYSKTKSAAPARDGDSDWVHLASGGVKLGYWTERFGVTLRGGVSHRTGGNASPWYGTRAVAPGVVHYSHRANLDRTVWTYGAGVNYAISKHAVVAAGYDGYAGRNTTAHIGSLAFIIPF